MRGKGRYTRLYAAVLKFQYDVLRVVAATELVELVTSLVGDCVVREWELKGYYACPLQKHSCSLRDPQRCDCMLSSRR